MRNNTSKNHMKMHSSLEPFFIIALLYFFLYILYENKNFCIQTLIEEQGLTNRPFQKSPAWKKKKKSQNYLLHHFESS